MLVGLLLSVVPLAYAKSSLDILVMGDWGGSPNKPYTTADEVDSAKIMGEVGATVAADMVWGLGDNFYDNGVKNENDPRFQETFEDVFTASAIKNIPYYMVAGNHDHYGNVTGEIEYSSHSDRWKFPSLYYNKVFDVPGTSYKLELIMIDTVELSGISHDRDYCDRHNVHPCLIQPIGPADPKLAANQWSWINSTLASSTADFVVVAGHYPVWSIAEHGSTGDLVKKLQPMLQANKATLYMSGHDHTFEYISTGDGVGYVDTGGTHTCDSSTAHTNTIPKGSLKFHGCQNGGFTLVHIDSTGMTVTYYFGKGTNSQYSATFKPRTQLIES